MGRRRSAALVAAAASAVVAVSGLTTGPASAATTADWSQYMANPFHQSAGQQGAITPATVPSLHAAWHLAAGDTVDAGVSVVGNRAFVVGRNAALYAVNTATGAVQWQKQLDAGSTAVCTLKGPVATPAVLPDPVTGALTVYAAGAQRLYAFDAATGAQRWMRAIGPATPSGAARYFNWSSPTVSGGRIFMGLAARCEDQNGLVRGGLVSVDQHTGALLHTYYDTPAGTVGGSIWSSAASDGTSVWVTTGNPDPNGSAVHRSYSIVRLSAATLAEQDWWTVSEAQAADSDFGSSPVLFPATVGGVRTLMVGACNKNGIFYAWRRGNLAAGPVWQRTIGTPNSWPTPCIGSAAYDGTSLYVASGPTTLGSQTVPGAVRALKPATGAVRWQKGLPCGSIGTPTVDLTSHVLAVPLFSCANASAGGTVLVRTTDGAVLRTLPSTSSVFAQPVFAAGRLYVATEGSGVTAYTG
jgi:putative pyrroloquinoline-quinone binding quinoprotein